VQASQMQGVQEQSSFTTHCSRSEGGPAHNLAEREQVGVGRSAPEARPPDAPTIRLFYRLYLA
jgi:hypothetical protein